MSLTRFTSLIIMIFGMVMFILAPLEENLKSIKDTVSSFGWNNRFNTYIRSWITIRSKG